VGKREVKFRVTGRKRNTYIVVIRAKRRFPWMGYNIYTGTETGSTRLTRNSRSSEMDRDLTLILVPLTSRRLRTASWSSPTVPAICMGSILPRA
jgi:hypothetical protein